MNYAHRLVCRNQPAEQRLRSSLCDVPCAGDGQIRKVPASLSRVGGLRFVCSDKYLFFFCSIYYVQPHL
ncbi:hypothetical protein BDZ97DRAFT_2077667, partial [Flammula alnicola]